MVVTGPLRTVVGLPDPVGLDCDVSGTVPRSAIPLTLWLRSTAHR
jgi:hypothetical protein